VEVIVTDRYGALAAATGHTTDLAQADESWWQAAWNDGRGAVYIGLPEVDESSGAFASTIAVPLYAHGTDEVIGVLRTIYRLDQLVRLIHSAGVSGHADLLLPSGQLLAPTGHRLIAADPSELEQLAVAAGADYAEFTFAGRPSLVSQAHIAAISGEPFIAAMGWTLIVHKDRAESIAPVAAAAQTMLVTALIALLLTGALAFAIAQAISAPIVRLKDATQQIAAGDLRRRLAFDRNDEIGALARSFNAMVEARMQHEGQLRDAEARYRALVEQNPGIIYDIRFSPPRPPTAITRALSSVSSASRTIARSANVSKRSCSRCRRSRASGSWPVGSPTISTTS
jgi:HAMP domain-containing protein